MVLYLEHAIRNAIRAHAWDAVLELLCELDEAMT